MGGGQDKPAWTACPPGVKITRVGGKITRDSLPPGGQAVQGGKINCYTTKLLLKNINLVKPSYNNYVVCSLVRWDQNILPMKFLNALF